ncbi:MAG: hypothetical protein ACFB0B_19615 [Thermonemataceae bacterium]
MKNFMHILAIAATTCIIGTTSCERRASEDEFNDFRALAEANDDSLQNELNALQDSIANAQNRQFAMGTLSGIYADSDTPFSVTFDFRETFDLAKSFNVYSDDDRRILQADFGIGRTLSAGGFASRNAAEDNLYFSIGIDMDANTLASINYISGQISEQISDNRSFEYGFYFDSGYEDVTASITNISYNADTEILAFDYNFSWDNGASVGFNNNKAASLTGTVNVVVPREVYDTYPDPQFRR